ncbi:hypothetical protein ACKWTF_007228 [Chironomus riparius]
MTYYADESDELKMKFVHYLKLSDSKKFRRLIKDFKIRNPVLCERLEEYAIWEKLWKITDSASAELEYTFWLMLSHFEHSSLQIKKELLQYMKLWKKYDGRRCLDSKVTKFLSKATHLEHELMEYTVMANISMRKYVNSNERCPKLPLPVFVRIPKGNRKEGLISSVLSSYFTLYFVNYSNSFTTNTSGPLRVITRSLPNKS